MTHRKDVDAVIDFKPNDERLFTLLLNGKSSNKTLINANAPTVVRGDSVKDVLNTAFTKQQ